ncbi:hypothetical protein SMACR_02314 [Sordaria macrospora]|uniref:JmjC domain-containing protein n=1 Tax=Sordaria macrospora TaxID=5147 RepID=A0A8S8ZXD0_SORMA|nr:hypothetical protein SMACR_02314 [Sordaria macrospora]WPJ64695.1 hypothetical protein SMAC4_02314 [Sordaria macrospora]
MPVASHPQAKFDPIPPDLDLHALVEKTPNFHWVLRVSAAQIRNIGPQEFERLVYLHVIRGGKPLVIEKWNDRLPKTLFSAEWLEDTYNKKQENVRDIVSQTDIPMTMGHYLRSMKQLTNQWTPNNFRDERRQRLYLKDIDCPPEWHERLQKVIPTNLFYMNDNLDRKASRRYDDYDYVEKSCAPAGDLMSSLPEEMRAQNLMCYVGHEGTYTPAHREMCASLGQNIMVDASGDENGEKPGSSIWFMTETKDREVVREYFLSILGHDIEIEKHFAQINAWKKANFPVYIVEQKVGDFVLVPPLAPHQVWNRGTRTIKVAWNRTTAETLEMALHEALPKARLVCRDEQYKNKAIIYFTLQKYYNQMREMEQNADIGLLGFGQDLMKNSFRMTQIAKDFKALFRLFTEILVDEMFAIKEKEIEYVEFDSCITCSYCRANIFNRFLTCKHCVRTLVTGDEDTYDICMECYAMGRSCLCVSNLTWCEQWKWSDLVDRYEEWRALIIKNDGYVDYDTSPLPLELARKKTGKKSVAQICQEQLRRRPWKDISKLDKPEEPEVSEPEFDENGKPKKKPRRKKKKGDVYRCHVCSHKDFTYKLAFCSNPGCSEAYCYGVLYRAFDLMPQEVLQNERWECPKCLKMCNCGACRRLKNGNVPYQPRNTLLGHDTRPIADDRSVETLVDFKVHNLNWLKTSGDDGRNVQSKRLQKLQQQAEAEKAKNADDVHIEVPALQNGEQAAGAENTDDALQQSIADGLGGGQERPDVKMNGTSAEQPSAAQPAGPAEVADMSIAPEDQDQSAYPDPDLFGQERMLGMGYYQQDDDSPDKILFDPYQRPTAEDYVVDEEPELMSEYLKKQLRLAKRRARHAEDDDPDFAAPRPHHRKKQKLDKTSSQPPPTRDGQDDVLENMDPALFDQTMPDVAGDIRAESAQAGASQPANGQPSDEAGEKSGQRLYPANVPTLRHARPKISYRVDEDNEEEFNDILIPRSQKPEYRAAAAPANVVQSIEGPTGPKDPLDLASAAVLAITGAGGDRSNEASQEPKSTRAAAAPSGPSKLRGPHKKRGRPPGRPRRSEAHDSEDEEMHEASEPSRRRGRPPRRPMAATDAEDSDHDEDIDAQLAQELDGFDENGEAVERDADASQAPKRRGRPPKNGVKKVTVEVTTRTPMLSLAERMKLKGKKFKIGERKSTGGTPAKVVAKPAPVDSIEKSASPAVSGRATRGAGKETSLPVRESPRTTRTRTTSATRQTVQPADEEPHHSESEREELEPEQEKEKSPEPARHSVSQASVRISPPRDEASPSKSPEPERSPSVSASPEPPSRAPSAPSVTRISPSPSPSPPPPPPKPAGPTVVRLMDTDDEESDYGGGSYHSGSRSTSQRSQSERSRSGSEAASGTGSEDEPSSDSDSDDEDIPARKESVRQSFTASRGRGGGVGIVSRGRGGIRGRGRGRGRPRGS